MNRLAAPKRINSKQKEDEEYKEPGSGSSIYGSQVLDSKRPPTTSAGAKVAYGATSSIKKVFNFTKPSYNGQNRPGTAQGIVGA